MNVQETSLKALYAFYKEHGLWFKTRDQPLNFLMHSPKQPLLKEPISRMPHKSPQDCASLEELRECLSSFPYGSLKDTAQNLVFSDGNPEASLMLIGEAPGADEDKEGLPFVGMSGKLLDKMLQAIGIDRTRCYITNIIPWRPPGNRSPTTEEIAFFLPFVKRHVQLIRPKLLVLVGGIAAKAVLGTTEGITKIRGRIIQSDDDGWGNIPILPTLHPAYLLRSPGQKALAWRDWLLVQRTLINAI